MDSQGKPKKTKKKVGNFIIDFGKQLGKGQFGVVHEAVAMDTNEKLAVKIIEKKLIYEDDYTKGALIRQIQIMKNVKSDNIIRFIDIQQTANNIYIFQQLADGGCLNDVLKKTPNHRLEQKDAIKYIVQILNGFRQLVNHGIIHRDIKLTNILMKNNHCKIADFGMSKYSSRVSSLSSVVGTPIYMAPQIMNYSQQQHSGYTYKCDIWSLGVLCYQLVTGTIPWKNISNCDMNDLLGKIKQQCKSGIQFPKNLKISEEFKNLVSGCLKYSQQQRFDWNQILKHKLFQGKFKQSNSNYENFTLTELRLKIHCNNVSLQKLVAKLPEECTKQDLYHLLKVLDDKITDQQSSNLFKAFAKQKNSISKKTILDNLQKHGIRLTGIKAKGEPKEQKITNIMQKISQKIEQQQVDLFSLFKKFDTQKNNKLSKQQFYSLLKSLYKEITPEELQEMYKHNDPANIGGVKFEDFYEKLCKVVQVPAVKNEAASKQIRKLEQRKKS